ncbi:hypothetical protein [Glycomyces harbinensis]|uniref:Uncharacterized protein n=1 Tax=Glycomyces harbinensis TaxID=58114 RepID=A0A1G7CKS6_9ACTN|nr:hypothetical protein [Glycomyces harbinensis]SDE39831.1 hypothetical protein SAMN05216270_12040 [Glycomyces harbinensis]
MDAYALLAMNLVKSEALSALPDAPVVPHRPTLFERISGAAGAARRSLIARDLRVDSLPKRADVRRAA